LAIDSSRVETESGFTLSLSRFSALAIVSLPEDPMKPKHSGKNNMDAPCILDVAAHDAMFIRFSNLEEVAVSCAIAALAVGDEAGADIALTTTSEVQRIVRKQR
jgi:hypothetical protein